MFSKKDLKTGMILQFENGDQSMVLLGTQNGDIFSGSKNWGKVSDFSEHFNCIYSMNDVCKVYQPTYNMSFLSEGVRASDDTCVIVWERKSKEDLEKEETIKQIKETEETLKKLRDKLEGK